MELERDKLLQPFIEGAIEMFTMMIGAPCDVQSAAESNPPFYISGIVDLSGDTTGQLVLSFPEEAARESVAQMLAIETEEVDTAMLQDGIGEMVNIVAGNAKSKLASLDISFLLSLPSTVVGPDHALELTNGNNEMMRCSLASELGNFQISVWVDVSNRLS